MKEGAYLESPATIAAIYLGFGILWIAVTDYLVHATVEDASLLTQVQMIKGGVFVILSTSLIYVLVWYGYRSHEETARRLDRSIQQSSILHRILRHNLRNICNVIKGNVEILLDSNPTSSTTHLRSIEEETNHLLELSDKTRYLRSVVMDDVNRTERIDLVELIEDEVARVEEKYPWAELTIDVPDSLIVEFDRRLERAIRELLENAIEHNDRLEPTISITIEPAEFGNIELIISDNGPGLPDIERNVLQAGYETPMFHSQGLGLWISRTIVSHNGGHFRITDNTPRGTVIHITIPVLGNRP